MLVVQEILWDWIKIPKRMFFDPCPKRIQIKIQIGLKLRIVIPIQSKSFRYRTLLVDMKTVNVHIYINKVTAPRNSMQRVVLVV